MDYVVNKFLEICTEEFSPYGFKRNGKAFVRVINDVMQNFAIEKLRSGRECRVLFAIVPLCLKIEKQYAKGGVYSQNLRRLEPVLDWNQWDCWTFNPKSEESMNECIAEMLLQTKKHLVPLFIRADSCKTAYDELCEVDRMIYANNLSMRLREVDKKSFKDGVFMLDNAKCYMALKNRNYSVAIEYLKAFEEQNIESYHSMLEMGYLKEEDRIRREESIARLGAEIEIISKPDENYIQELIEQNEAYSIANLSKYIV